MSMSKEKAARILEVSLGCNVEELRNAYRARVREVNPDMDDNPTTQSNITGSKKKRFQEISEAYTLLVSALEHEEFNRKGADFEAAGDDERSHVDLKQSFASSATPNSSRTFDMSSSHSLMQNSRYATGSNSSGSGKKKKKKNTASNMNNNSGSIMSGAGIHGPPAPELAQMWSHRELLSRHCSTSLEDVGASGVVFTNNNNGNANKHKKGQGGAGAGNKNANVAFPFVNDNNNISSDAEGFGGTKPVIHSFSSTSKSFPNASSHHTSNTKNGIHVNAQKNSSSNNSSCGSGGVSASIINNIDLSALAQSSGFNITDIGLDMTAAAAAAAMGVMNNSIPYPNATGSVDMNNNGSGGANWSWKSGSGNSASSNSKASMGGGTAGNCSESEMKALMSMFVEFMGMFSEQEHSSGSSSGSGSQSKNSFSIPHQVENFDPSLFQSLRMNMAANANNMNANSANSGDSKGSAASSGGFPVFSMMFGGGAGKDGSVGGYKLPNDAFEKWVDYANNDGGGEEMDDDKSCPYSEDEHDDETGSSFTGSQNDTGHNTIPQSQPQSRDPKPMPTARMTIAAIHKLRDAIKASNLHVSLQQEKGATNTRTTSTDSNDTKCRPSANTYASSNNARGEKDDTRGGGDDMNRNQKSSSFDTVDTGLNAKSNASVSSSWNTSHLDSTTNVAQARKSPSSTERGNDKHTNNNTEDIDRARKAARKREKKSRKKEKAKRDAAERAAQVAQKRREAKIVSWRSRVITACTSGELARLETLLSDSPFKIKKNMNNNNAGVGKGGGPGKNGGPPQKLTSDENDDIQSNASSTDQATLNDYSSIDPNEDRMQHMEWLIPVCLSKCKNNSKQEREARHKLSLYVMNTAFDAILIPGKNGRSALHVACQLGDLNFVKAAIERCAATTNQDVDYGKERTMPSTFLEGLCDDSGWSPLHYAVANGAEDVMEELLAAGCNVFCLTDPALTRNSCGNGVTARDLMGSILSGKAVSAFICHGRALDESESNINDAHSNSSFKRLFERMIDRLSEVENSGYCPPVQGGVSKKDDISLSTFSSKCVSPERPAVKDSDGGSGSKTAPSQINPAAKTITVDNVKKKKAKRKKKQQNATPAATSAAPSKPQGSIKEVETNDVDPLVTALLAMGFSEDQINSAAKACGGTERATADDLVAWIFEQEAGGNCGDDGEVGLSETVSQNRASQADSLPNDLSGSNVELGLRDDSGASSTTSVTESYQGISNQMEQMQQQRLAANAAARAKKQATEAAEREAALATAQRLAAKREEQRRINREWNNREQMRQREEQQSKLSEETERRRKAELHRTRIEAQRKGKERPSQKTVPVAASASSVNASANSNASFHTNHIDTHHQQFHGYSSQTSGGLHPMGAGGTNVPPPSLIAQTSQGSQYSVPSPPGTNQFHSSFPVDGGSHQASSHSGGNSGLIHMNTFPDGHTNQSRSNKQSDSSMRMGVSNNYHQQTLPGPLEGNLNMTQQNITGAFNHSSGGENAQAFTESMQNSAPVYMDSYGRRVENRGQFMSATNVPEDHDTLSSFPNGKGQQSLDVNPLDFPELGKGFEPTSEIVNNEQSSETHQSEEKLLVENDLNDTNPSMKKYLEIPSDDEPNHLGVIRATAKAFVPTFSVNTTSSANPPASAPRASTSPAPPPGLGATSSSRPNSRPLSPMTAPSAEPNGSAESLLSPVRSLLSSLTPSGIATSNADESHSSLPPVTSLLASVSPSLIANPGVENSPMLHPNLSGTGAVGTDNFNAALSTQHNSLFESVSIGASEHGTSGDPFSAMGVNSIWGGGSGNSTGLGGLASLGFAERSISIQESFQSVSGEKKDDLTAVGASWPSGGSNNIGSNNIW